MIVTLVVASVPQPYGGNIVCYELANGLQRQGHRTNLVHVGPVAGLGNLAWFHFESGIRHSFVGRGPLEAAALPAADFIVNPPGGEAGRRAASTIGLPLNLIQGHGAFRQEVHDARMTAPWPKLCIATWLLDVGRELGVPQHQLVHLPPGIDHATYRVITPLDQRPLQVAALYHLHPAKGVEFAISAMSEVRRRIPAVQSVLFGVTEVEHELPPGAVYLHDPPRRVLVERAYNESRVFVCASTQEGFGLCSVEAMACGSALVTSATRGSDDFAHQGQTALVSAPRDVRAMADNIELLLRDDAQRLALAERGVSSVARFSWDESVRILTDFLERYAENPERYREAQPRCEA